MIRSRELTVRWSVALLLLLAALIAWSSVGFFGQSLLAETLIFALFAMSVDFLAGGAGLMSLGQAMYFGLGAYVTAVLTTLWDVGALVTVPIGIGIAAVVALIIGSVIVRFGEIIFIMLTLAAGEMLYAYIFANRTVGGSDGISGIPRADLTGIGLNLNSGPAFSIVIIIITFAIFVVFDGLLRSPFGLILSAVRQNPARARALGARVNSLRTVAYVISSAVAALAGSLLAQLNHYASPDLAGWDLSGLVLIMAIFGGLGSLSGAALGAAIVQLLSHFISRFTSHWGLVLGVIFILVVLFADRGLFALLLAAANRLITPRGRKPC
jgi:branched-chain amino acid transport system permease protein